VLGEMSRGWGLLLVRSGVQAWFAAVSTVPSQSMLEETDAVFRNYALRSSSLLYYARDVIAREL
jgi:hypothetical protein